MNNKTYGWTAGFFAVALCALVLVFSSPGAEAQSNNGGQNGLAHRVAALEATVLAQQAMIDQLAADLAAETAARIQGDADTLAAANAYTDSQNSGLTTRVYTLEEKTQFMSVLGTTTLFSGTNVQVVNGMGDTETTNALGNLIVGYNKVEGSAGDERSGSHNMVIGNGHDYLSYGGLIAGYRNRIEGRYPSVTAGGNNVASGPYSSVSGGVGNRALSKFTSLSGGANNIASGNYSSVTGGTGNISAHIQSTISGGYHLITTEDYQWMGGHYHSP